MKLPNYPVVSFSVPKLSQRLGHPEDDSKEFSVTGR